MKKITCAVFLLSALASPALAGPIDYAFGNTVRVDEAGSTTDYYLNEDGTFTTSAGDSGTWVIDDTQICTTIADATNCGPFHADRQVGDTWTDTHEDGSQTTVTIVEGR